MARRMTYLRRHPKTSVWYFRRTIPPGLRSRFGGKTDWYESLRTKDVEEAKRRAKLVGLKVDAAFSEAERQVAANPTDPAGETVGDFNNQAWVRNITDMMELPVVSRPLAYDEITLEDAKVIASTWVKDRLAIHEERVATGGVIERVYGPIPLPDLRGLWVSVDVESYRFEIGRRLNRPAHRVATAEQVRNPDLTSEKVEIGVWQAASRFGLILDPAGDSWRRLRYAILLVEQTIIDGIEKINPGLGNPAPVPAQTEIREFLRIEMEKRKRRKKRRNRPERGFPNSTRCMPLKPKLRQRWLWNMQRY